MRSKARERILAVERILNDKPKTANDIVRELHDKYEMKCDRKAVYQDIAALTMHMNVQQDAKGYYIEANDSH